MELFSIRIQRTFQLVSTINYTKKQNHYEENTFYFRIRFTARCWL